MYSGAGSAPMLTAAAAWNGLADELGMAASSFSSMISDLVGSAWQGPASAAMAAVAGPYAHWLDAAATHAGGAAVGATTVATVFEQARAAVVHPLAIATNRNQMISLVVSNVFGFNAPAIAFKDAEYEAMWVQDVTAMIGYHSGASAVAEQLAPLQQALKALPGQVAAAVGASPAALAPAAAAANPAATAFEYGLIAALVGTPLVVAIGNLETTVARSAAVFTPAVKAAIAGITSATAPVVAAVEPVAKAIAATPIVAAATAAIAPVAAQVTAAVNGVADVATATVGQVSTAATGALTALETTALTQQIALVTGNPALLSNFVPLLTSNPALLSGVYGFLASNPQLVAGLLAQVQNNPALAAQIIATFNQIQASNPALAAQLLSLATQLGNQLGIAPAA
ncbi:hypothetical protein BST12_10110 [Mycobacterium angelicum]|uniref:PPE domain-containing protein n=2 Tax=Mycobacterium angelicum TaxID=470074 RepID=A0A1W9ZWH3_MYCAN|nr:hypothetical protein BST12_10110 [Mycobacterium angelicum]